MPGKDLVGGFQKILTRLFFLDILIRFPDTLNLKRHVNCECPVKEDPDRKKSDSKKWLNALARSISVGRFKKLYHCFFWTLLLILKRLYIKLPCSYINPLHATVLFLQPHIKRQKTKYQWHKMVKKAGNLVFILVVDIALGNT